jgi:hypothetical protein
MASELIVQNLKGPAGGSNPNTVILPAGQTLDASGGTLVPSAGAVVQVVNAAQQNAGTISGNTWTTIVNATITPKSINNKIIVTCDGTFGNPTTGALESAVRTYSSATGPVQVSTAGTGLQTNANANVYIPAGSYETVSTSWTVIDEPSTTSAVTYSLQAFASEGQNMHYGRADSSANGNWVTRSSLRILLMEIAG